jgi:ribosome-binding protein aMBF1 (putative translation factor)
MALSLSQTDTALHRVIPEKASAMAKAGIRKAENDEIQAEIGGCLDYARREVGWTLDQLAAELGRDPRQIRRWIAGEETLQMHVAWKVQALRQPFVIALAKLAACAIEVVIRARVTA